MKHATYFEDLQKTNFVIRVEDDSCGAIYLESRQWHQNDYEYTPSDDFDNFCKTGDYDGVTKYKWIEERSQLMGVSDDTPKWGDRKWVPAPKAPVEQPT